MPPASPLACQRFCATALRCLPDAMARLALVQRTFPTDCAAQCATLDAAAVECAADRGCAELQAGTCGGAIGEKIRALGGL